MHPHLVGDSKQQHCKEFIDALNQCHARGYWHKLMGNCNGQKEKLNLCLRKERLARSEANRNSAKIQREKTQQVWKDIDEEE